PIVGGGAAFAALTADAEARSRSAPAFGDEAADRRQSHRLEALSRSGGSPIRRTAAIETRSWSPHSILPIQEAIYGDRSASRYQYRSRFRSSWVDSGTQNTVP